MVDPDHRLQILVEGVSEVVKSVVIIIDYIAFYYLPDILQVAVAYEEGGPLNGE
jgi:hypothetical protein